MSWYRFGCDDSDVYVYGGEQDGKNCVTCFGCRLLPEDGLQDEQHFFTAQEASDHMKAHIDAGHHVPELPDPSTFRVWVP